MSSDSSAAPDQQPNRSRDRPPALEALLCFDLYAASRAVTARYRPLLGDLGLTYPQYLVLVLLHERSRLAVRDIASSLRLDHGTLTPLLRRMESAGLVTRARSRLDERVVEIGVTDAGEAMRARFEDVQCVIREAMGLSPEQAHDLQGRLRELTATIERRDADDADDADAADDGSDGGRIAG